MYSDNSAIYNLLYLLIIFGYMEGRESCESSDGTWCYWPHIRPHTIAYIITHELHTHATNEPHLLLIYGK